MPSQSDVDAWSVSINVLVQDEFGAKHIILDDIVLREAVKYAL